MYALRVDRTAIELEFGPTAELRPGEEPRPAALTDVDGSPIPVRSEGFLR